MNITLDTQYSLPHETTADTTTTYRTDTGAVGVTSIGYSLDIADNKVTDDAAYQGHGLTTQDIMSNASNQNLEAQKDFMIVMSNSVSGETLQEVEEEGFRADTTDVGTFVSIVDRIKVTLAQSGVVIAGYNDDLDSAMVEEITGSVVSAGELTKGMQQLQVPITGENLTQLTEAGEKAAALEPLSEDAMKYMLLNQLSPTIDNLYLAQFSSAEELRQAKGYYSDYAGGYLAKKADSVSWENLQGSIDRVIEQSGLDNTPETQESAKWLVESGIELTSDNLEQLTQLKELSLPLEAQQIIDLTVTAMHNGKQPQTALVTGEAPIEEQAAQLVEQAAGISDEAIHTVVSSNETINLKNLAAAQQQLSEGTEQPISTETVSLRELEARRQMEEIRLMMTEEANLHLIKSGMQVDTTELSQLVEALKADEAGQKALLFHGETTEINDQRAQLYDNTLDVAAQLAQMPAALLGRVATAQEPYTLTSLQNEGTQLQSRYERAGETYEALMTAPRRDLGDSISKAFANVDDILEDMGLETSEANRRAVRILGYNSMELTEENISAVKEADSLVTGVIRRMTPATTLNMIREQVNPLELNLDELDEYLNTQDKDTGDDAEKFSRYLQKLDSSNAISEEEREAYIGIYRLFRQIEKSDGAVIGSVVAQGAEMNFKNMLSAIRTNKSKGMDVTVDESYGALEDLITNGKGIDAQIMAGFEQSASEESNRQSAKEQYYARLSGEIKDELAQKASVETLQELTIQPDTTIEAFADELQGSMDQQGQSSEEQQQRLQSMREAVREAQAVEESVIQSLIDYDQPVSIANIQAASLLLNERGSLYRKIFGRSGAADTENDTAVNDAFESVGDAEDDSLEELIGHTVESLTDQESASSAYSELVGEATQAIDRIIDTSSSVLDIRAAQSLYKGLSLAGSLAREENYELPVYINGELTSVNLKIYRNSAEAGKVTVTMDSDSLGKVAADFDVTPSRISGMIAYDQQASAAQLTGLMQDFEQAAGTEKIVSVSLVQSSDLNLDNFGQERDSKATQRVSTTELYHTAKAFMSAVLQMK